MPPPRDQFARLRALAAEHGYTVERGPVKGGFILRPEDGSDPPRSPRTTLTWRLDEAVRYFQQRKKNAAPA